MMRRLNGLGFSGRGAIIALRLAAFALAVAGLAVTPARAIAEALADSGGELYSVENRRLLGTHEISAAVGTLPLDSFVIGVTLQGSYTYNFDHLFGWEVLGGIYSFNIDTGLEDELREDFDVVPEREEELKGLLSSNFVFRPLYGKIATLNEKIRGAELFFVGGPTVGIRSASAPFGIDLGMGVRFFASRHVSFRFDIRDYLLFPDFSDVVNNLYLSLGLSLSFGFADEPEEQE